MKKGLKTSPYPNKKREVRRKKSNNPTNSAGIIQQYGKKRLIYPTIQQRKSNNPTDLAVNELDLSNNRGGAGYDDIEIIQQPTNNIQQNPTIETGGQVLDISQIQPIDTVGDSDSIGANDVDFTSSMPTVSLLSLTKQKRSLQNMLSRDKKQLETAHGKRWADLTANIRSYTAKIEQLNGAINSLKKQQAAEEKAIKKTKVKFETE